MKVKYSYTSAQDTHSKFLRSGGKVRYVFIRFSSESANRINVSFSPIELLIGQRILHGEQTNIKGLREQQRGTYALPAWGWGGPDPNSEDVFKGPQCSQSSLNLHFLFQ